MLQSDKISWLRICDAIEEKFVKNPRPAAFDRKLDTCVYNHDAYGGCAVGCLISKELAGLLPTYAVNTLKYLEQSNEPGGHWLRLILKELKLSDDPANIEHLARLQQIHDILVDECPDPHDQKNVLPLRMSEWVKNMRALVASYE